MVEDAGISSRIAARCPADRALVYFDHFIYGIQTLDFLIRHRLLLKVVVAVFAQNGIKGFIDQGAFPASRHAADAHEGPQGYFNIDIPEVIPRSALQLSLRGLSPV